MFYVSSIKGDKIGVTDTADGVEEFYTDSQIVQFLESKVDIYGTSYYNHKANCSVIKINQNLNVDLLRTLLSSWKKLHNQWEGHKVEDLLASSKVGTRITVQYIVQCSNGTKERGQTVLTRVDNDYWDFKDTSNVMSGKFGDSRFAAQALEIACIYSTPLRIGVDYV